MQQWLVAVLLLELALGSVYVSASSPFLMCADECAPSITFCSQKSNCSELAECVLSTPRHSDVSLHSLIQTCSSKLSSGHADFTLDQQSVEAASTVVSCLWKACPALSSPSSLSSVTLNGGSSASLGVGLQDTPLNTCGDKCTDVVVACSAPELLGCVDIVRCALAVPRTSAISLHSSVANCARHVHLRSNQLNFDENKLAAAAFAAVSCSRRACPLSSSSSADKTDESLTVKTSHSLVNPAILFPPGILGGASTNEAAPAAAPPAPADTAVAPVAAATESAPPLLNMNMCGGLCTSQAVQCAQPSMLGCPEIVRCVESSTPPPTRKSLASTLATCARQVHLRSNQLEFDEQTLSEAARAVLECENRWCPPKDIDESDSDVPRPPGPSSSPCSTRRTMSTCSCQFYELPVSFCWAPLACREACGGRMDSACTLNEGDGQHYCQCCPVNL